MLTDLNAKISITSFWIFSYVKLLWLFFSHFEISPLHSSCQQSSWINCQVTSPTKGYFQHVWQCNTYCLIFLSGCSHFFFFLLKAEETQYVSSTESSRILIAFWSLKKASILHFFLGFSICKSRLISSDSERLLTKRTLNGCLLLVSKAPPKWYKGSGALCHLFWTWPPTQLSAVEDPCLHTLSLSGVNCKGDPWDTGSSGEALGPRGHHSLRQFSCELWAGSAQGCTREMATWIQNIYKGWN